MNSTRFRITLTLLGLALIGVVVAVVLFAPTGRAAVVPDAVERFSPGQGDTVQRQVSVMVDMKVGYDIRLFVDGVEIPQDFLKFTEATGVTEWRPTGDNGNLEWPVGEHSIAVAYNRTIGTADTGEFTWTFRVQ
jgi:hypothetical protein